MATSSMKFLVFIVILSMAINGAVEARAGSDWLHSLPKGSQYPPSGPSPVHHQTFPPPTEEFHYRPKGSPTPPSDPTHGSSPGTSPAY